MNEPMQTVLEQDLCAIVANDLPWERLSGTRVVVTGAAGFLGNYLVRTLVALHRLGKVSRPVEVVAMVRRPGSARGRFADRLDTGAIKPVARDLNTSAVPDIVGTASLLQALGRCPDRLGLAHVSSSEAYGRSPTAGRLTRHTTASSTRPRCARATSRASALARRCASPGTTSTPCPPSLCGRSTPMARDWRRWKDACLPTFRTTLFETSWPAMRTELRRYPLFWLMLLPMGRCPGWLAQPFYQAWRVADRLSRDCAGLRLRVAFGRGVAR